MQVNRINGNKGAGNVRENIPSSAESQVELSQRGVSGGNGESRSFNGAARNVNTFVLKKDLKPLSPFKLGVEKLCSYDSDKSNEILVSLYKCLKQNKDFKDNKEWDQLPETSELADYLFSQVTQLCPKGWDWRFFENNDQYNIVYFKVLESKHSSHSMPLEWLLQIKKTNKALHDLILLVISKVAFAYSLNVIQHTYNDFIIDDKDAHYSGEPEDDILLDRHVYEHKQGKARVMLREIWKLGHSKSKTNLKARISRIKPNSQKMREIKRWLELGLEALKNPYSLSNYVFYYSDPHCNEGEPLNPMDTHSFEWSFYDVVFKHSDNLMNDVYQNTGVCEETLSTFYTEDKAIAAAPEDALRRLEAFMSKGRTIYYNFYDTQCQKQYRKEEKELSIELNGIDAEIAC